MKSDATRTHIHERTGMCPPKKDEVSTPFSLLRSIPVITWLTLQPYQASKVFPMIKGNSLKSTKVFLMQLDLAFSPFPWVRAQLSLLTQDKQDSLVRLHTPHSPLLLPSPSTNLPFKLWSSPTSGHSITATYGPPHLSFTEVWPPPFTSATRRVICKLLTPTAVSMSHLLGKEHFELLGGRILNTEAVVQGQQDSTRPVVVAPCSFPKTRALKSLLTQTGSGLQAVDCGTRSYREVVRADWLQTIAGDSKRQIPGEKHQSLTPSLLLGAQGTTSEQVKTHFPQSNQ